MGGKHPADKGEHRWKRYAELWWNHERKTKRRNDGRELPEAHSRWVTIDVPHLCDFVIEKKIEATEERNEPENTGWVVETAEATVHGL